MFRAADISPEVHLRGSIAVLYTKHRFCSTKPCSSNVVLCRATARDGESPVVSQADLLHGAQLQLRGALRMKDFDRRRIPTRGLEAVLLPKELKANLDKIVHHEKVSSSARCKSVTAAAYYCFACAEGEIRIHSVLVNVSLP